MTTLEHTFIQANGIKLHIVLFGPVDGEPLLLLRGFPEYWGGWTPFGQGKSRRWRRLAIASSPLTNAGTDNRTRRAAWRPTPCLN